MSKAKTASKNNPSTRESAKKFYHNGMEIKTVKLISEKSTFFAAEYEGTGDLVVGSDGTPLPWNRAKGSS